MLSKKSSISRLRAERKLSSKFGKMVSTGDAACTLRILSHCAAKLFVKADARLEKVEGRRLKFSVSVSDERGLVAAGKVTRVVVERERFLDKSR